MNMLPAKMAEPAMLAANQTTMAFRQLMDTVNAMQATSPAASPVSGISASAGAMSSNVSFNISGVNIGSNEKPTAEMQKYIEGVAVQVAHKVLRQNTAFGGLV
jgi:cobalamin biosynthesis protein CobD/CbiB